MMPNCTDFAASVRLPTASHGSSARAAFVRQTELARQSATRRRVWDCIVFGFELPMLLLHMRTLEAVVDGFLVTESTTCFQTAMEKPSVLATALANGSFPAPLAAMTTVKQVSRADAIAAGCEDVAGTPSATRGRHQAYTGRCFQSVQRFALLELVDAKAAPDDLVFIADVDEIASPSLVQLLRTCAPFPPYATWVTDDEHSGFLHILARQYRFGVHCDTGERWRDGPRLYLAGWLRRQRQAASTRALTPKSFDALRPMGSGKALAEVVVGGAWHLTSFGTTDELLRKLTTFGAAGKFGGGSGALNRQRIEACWRVCANLLVTATPTGGTTVPTPCHLEGGVALKRRSQNPALIQHSLDGVVPPDWPLTPAVLRMTFVDGDLPPPLLTHPEDFPPAWFAGLRERPARWSLAPRETPRPALVLRRCAASAAASTEGKLPALLLYLLGDIGPQMARGIFEFARDEDVGDVYTVSEATASAPRFTGAMAERKCDVIRSAMRWALVPAFAAGNHYSGRWCMQKLELLTHLPHYVESAVLLDADAYVLPNGMRLLGGYIRDLKAPRFAAVPRTDARVHLVLRNGTRSLRVPHRSEGINSGMLALNVTRMRAFGETFCPGRSWWSCVLDTQPRGYNDVGGDQAVWNAMLVDRPDLFTQLPCSTHLSVDALRSAAMRIARGVGVPLCEARPLADGTAVKPGQVFVPQMRRNADSCSDDQRVYADDPRWGPVPRAAKPWPHGVAITHGAARLQPLARLVAALLSSPSDEERRAILAAFPCWCYQYIRSDGSATFGALPGTPKGDTSCHKLSLSRVRAPASGSTLPLDGAVPPHHSEPPRPPQPPQPQLAAEDDGLPSFSAVEVGCGDVSHTPTTPRAAFCLTGQPRTFLHPEAQASIIKAARSFGAHAYIFFFLTDDDGGSSWAHPPIRESRARVHAAMATFRPKLAAYGSLNESDSYAAHRRQQCGLPPEGPTRAIGGRPFMKTFFETHVKLKSCYEAVVQYELAHRLRFDWIVRMRPDAWFFGNLVPHCRLAPTEISFPVGVVGCGYSPCINDHLAFTPRSLARYYFSIVTDMQSCAGMRNLSRHWKDYNLWRLKEQRVPLASPSPLIPYTLLRPCGNASISSFYPECHRWTSKPLEKNAGLAYYSNGSALPDLSRYRRERVKVHRRCRAAAAAAFPAFEGVDGNGEFNMARLRKCTSKPQRFTASGPGSVASIKGNAKSKTAVAGLPSRTWRPGRVRE
jgi:hypothetical protein